ncbi:MAG TPA: SDR family NAD(P)-dependent oxidoreductase, partial [Planctomycetota bacterium]|nr:SDR family NAD(P)-dependent oxidoreductase [Planctomycetota bacterium]
MSARHVVVTGAGTGIGRAIALRFAREGAQLSLVARDAQRLEQAASEARAAGAAAARAFRCDIRRRADVEAAFETLTAEHGPVAVLVANSGIGGPNAPGGEDRFEDLVATNLNGTYHCLRAAQPRLAAPPTARHLIVVASILARIGVPGYTGYCASKAGLLGLVRALAAELAPEDVAVNAVCPGWVDTDMAREGLAGMAQGLGISAEEAHAKAMEAVPLRRMSAPQDIAGLVAWLASPDSRGVTG